MTPTQAAACFNVLSNERRLRTLYAIRQSPTGATPTLLGATLGFGQAIASQCLAELFAAELVVCGRAGRHKIYYSNEDTIRQLSAFLKETQLCT